MAIYSINAWVSRNLKSSLNTHTHKLDVRVTAEQADVSTAVTTNIL